MSDTAQCASCTNGINRGKLNSLFTVSAITLAVLISYIFGVDGELVGDSRELIIGNSTIHEPWDIWKIWTNNYWGDVLFAGNYRPLAVWTYALNYRFNTAMGLAADSTWTYRLVNILFHVGVVWAVYKLAGLWGLGEKGKWWAAIAFAWHPLHVEAVTSVVGRAECIAALAGIGFVYSHRLQQTGWAGLLLLLSMWGKESGVAFVAVGVWADWCWGTFRIQRMLKAYGFYAIIIIAWVGWRYYALAGQGVVVEVLDNPLADADIGTRIRTAIAIQGQYVKLMVWPFGFSSDYSFAQLALVKDWSDPRWYIPALLTTGGTWGVWQLRSRFVATAWGAYWLLALPTANLLILIGTIMGERLVYAPSIMAAILWGWCAEVALRSWPRVGSGLLATTLVIWCALCVQRTETWQNRDIYHRAQLQDAPASARAHLGMGVLYLEVGQVDSALNYLSSAVSIYPNYAEAQYNWGVGLSYTGNWPAARKKFERAVSLNASLYQAWYNLGLARHKTGDLVGAVLAYERALGLRGEDAETWYNMGEAQWQLGRPEEAVESLMVACELKPEWRGGWERLAELAQRQKNKKSEMYAREKLRVLP